MKIKSYSKFWHRIFTVRYEKCWLGIVVLIVIISRWLGRSLYLYNTDSVLYALSLDKYDVSIQQPHPPGYALYVLFTKPIYWLVNDANTALVITSIIFSVLSVYAIFYLAKKITNIKIAWVSLGLIVFAPLFWFHGQVAMNYVTDVFFSAWVGFHLYDALTSDQPKKRWRSLMWASIALGLGGGFRPTLVLFMAPLWLWSIWVQRRWRIGLINFGILSGITLSWLLPAAYLSGGLIDFWHAVAAMFFTKSGIYDFSVFSGDFWVRLGQHLRWIAEHLVVNFGLAAVLVAIFIIYLFAPHWEKLKSDRLTSLFWLVWIMPALIFYTLIIFNMSGYLLVILPAVTIVIAGALVGLAKQIVAVLPQKQMQANQLRMIVIMMILVMGVNILVYIGQPTGFVEMQRSTHSSIARDNYIWQTVFPLIRENFHPQSTIIGIEKPYVSWGLQHFQYYLPEYLTYGKFFGGFYNPDNKAWFMAYQRQITLIDNLVIAPTDKKLIIIRNNWGQVTPPLSRIVIPGNLGELGYYDLTDLGTRELVNDLDSIQVIDEQINKD
ncbi:DUF2723 domain-containing protein [Patescibacteria group bacterium]|nr:DUF2723 domain-containing protein [Patescibacteria group bacterium]